MQERLISKLRLETCINTLLDIHRFLESKGLHPQVTLQLEKLRDSVSLLDLELVREIDLQRIEEATNRLLKELTFVFREEEKGILSGNNKPLH